MNAIWNGEISAFIINQRQAIFLSYRLLWSLETRWWANSKVAAIMHMEVTKVLVVNLLSVIQIALLQIFFKQFKQQFNLLIEAITEV